jgi:hypothetical protein
MESNVAVYIAKSQIEGAEVPGLALVFATATEATKAYELAVAPTFEGRLPPSRIEFSSPNDVARASFTFTSQSHDENLYLRVDDFPWSHVEQLRTGLERVLYFFVIFGYLGDRESVALLNPAEHYLFKNELIINGAIVAGQKIDEVDWNSVFGETAHILLGSLEGS